MCRRGQVQWFFNPPTGHHFALHEQTIDEKHLQTADCEVEAILNEGALTTSSDDLKELVNHDIKETGLISKDDY